METDILSFAVLSYHRHETGRFLPSHLFVDPKNIAKDFLGRRRAWSRWPSKKIQRTTFLRQSL